MTRPQSAHVVRKRRGDYPTPSWLVESIVEQTVPAVSPGQEVTVLDPACGDGRFLVAAAQRLVRVGARPVLAGVDIDAAAVRASRRALAGCGAADVRVEQGDALAMAWGDRRFDVVLGNPPFLSQMAASTTRGGASRHGGGPYADAAVEFLALSMRLARAGGGRVGLVLPQSILATRDAALVRAEVDRLATLRWSWWSPQLVFEAQVLVCALAWELRRQPLDRAVPRSWTHVVTDALDVPALPTLTTAGSLGDRARLTANFRDQYYGLVPSVVDGGAGPPLITSGLVDPGRCRWGTRSVTFARRRLVRPTVELDRLAPTMRRWAEALLTPKVLVANQTRVVEAVADPDGRWLPGVPLITARPADGADVWEMAAVLTSPVASVWAWHRAAGTGLSARTVRLGPRWLAELPWPRGDLAPAVAALRAGDVVACGAAASAAYGTVAADPALHEWWRAALPAAEPF